MAIDRTYVSVRSPLFLLLREENINLKLVNKIITGSIIMLIVLTIL